MRKQRPSPGSIVDPRVLKSVRVGAFDYAVRWVEAPRELVKDVGQQHDETCELMIVLNGTPQFLADTLLHEVLHAVVQAQGLRLHPPFNDEGVEERMVSALSTGLVQVLRDNPQLVLLLVQLANGVRA